LSQFCTCGSIMINEQCTNKNCSLKPAAKSATGKSAGRGAGRGTSTASKEPKKANPRKSSKCITYNIDELDARKKEENIE
jgi:hypothetical protein